VTLDRGPDGRSTDLASYGGVPRWLEASLNYCSRCGEPLVFGEIDGEDRHRLACVNGHITYVNPRLVVMTLPITDRGEVVLLRRGLEPGLGSWAQPGGFLEVDETVTEAAIRETREETGLEVRVGELVGFYARLEAAVIVVAFEAEIVGGNLSTSREAIEVRPFSAAEIPWAGIAFKTTYYVLADWLARRHPHLQPEMSGPQRF